jgi:DNA ligase-1
MISHTLLKKCNHIFSMYFSYLVDVFEQMEHTTSRLTLTDYLVSLFKKTPPNIIDKVVYLIQGKLHPDYEGIELGIAEKMVLRALSQSSGTEMPSILESYRKTGDIGDTAKEIMSSMKGVTTSFLKQKMTVEHVYSTLDKIAGTTGKGSQDLKIRHISGLLINLTPREARYIMKLVMGTLRLGIAEYSILDALAIAFTRDKSNRKILENAYNVSSDLGTVSKVLASKGIESVKSIEISLYKPIRPMLAERVRTAQEALEKMSGTGAAAEYKLDGERVQIHKGKEENKDKAELFSRRLEKITHHYPEIVEPISTSLRVKEAILEAEVVAINPQTSELLPFQELMHRRRKHNVQEAMEGYPIVVNIFDVLFIDGDNKTSLPYSKRRELLEKITRGLLNKNKNHNNNNNYNMISLAPQIIVKDSEQIEKFMASAIEAGCDGLMIKQLTSTYRAGAREYFWVKLKREYRSELADTLDLVIVGALYGRGRRVGKYGALLLAAYDHGSDIFRSACKVGTGFTDKSLADFYSNLEKYIIKHRHPRVDTGMEMNVWFEPKIVIEVIASEITLSPSHTAGMHSIRQDCGLSLRFPKFTGKIRDDKNPEDATTVKELISIYKRQIRASH